jgi:hypothetical protein
MAISNAQQAKQLLQDGGMLVKPGFGGTRQGYRGDAAAASGAPGMADPGPAGDVGDGPATGAQFGSDKLATEKQDFFTQSYTGPEVLGGLFGGYRDTVVPDTTAFGNRSRLGSLAKTAFGALVGIPGLGFLRDIKVNPTTTTDDDDDSDQREGGDDRPYFQRLGFPTEAAYLASLRQPMSGVPAATAPTQSMDLNRIAYRLMADGGFIDEEDEPRQAYGLGSIVRKITRPIKKVVKKATKTVKKVTKSPLGRLAIAIAAPYALGPAFGTGVMGSLSAAQKAALISGATTGITQLASGEDLDLKDIAVSAAIGGTSAKFFPPGGAKPGVDGKSVAASRASSPNLFDADDVVLASQKAASDPSKFTAFTKEVLNPQGIAQTDPTIFSRIAEGVGKIGDSKILQFAKERPFLTIAGASGLAGLMAKKDQEPEEFTDQDRGEGIDVAAIRRRPFNFIAPRFAGSRFDFYDQAAADGGRIGYQKGSKEPVAKKTMPLLDMGGMEKDYREEGGFVPIGRMEKADDVPARLSKNEFVFTADAVRNAGDGNVDKGAEVMYNMMKNLEAGGDVSKESQGLKGARRMFQTSQRLEEVL